ncbi:MAG: hypothetical protein O7A06_01855 [Acidobacteria bacterium]|nr:hypothetical protein [Acidobacteriota bacterium]
MSLLDPPPPALLLELLEETPFIWGELPPRLLLELPPLEDCAASVVAASNPVAIARPRINVPVLKIDLRFRITFSPESSFSKNVSYGGWARVAPIVLLFRQLMFIPYDHWLGRSRSASLINTNRSNQ